MTQFFPATKKKKIRNKLSCIFNCINCVKQCFIFSCWKLEDFVICSSADLKKFYGNIHTTYMYQYFKAYMCINITYMVSNWNCFPEVTATLVTFFFFFFGNMSIFSSLFSVLSLLLKPYNSHCPFLASKFKKRSVHKTLPSREETVSWKTFPSWIEPEQYVLGHSLKPSSSVNILAVHWKQISLQFYC